MGLTTNLRLKALDWRLLESVADWLAVGVAVSLPWSTSATAILVLLWLFAVLPTLDVAAVRRELASAAGGLPVLLWVLAAAGMLWANVSWSERLTDLASFHRLLAIPLLLAQFRRSEHGTRVLVGFFLSVAAVLLFSVALAVFPAIPWHTDQFGVPVKDYILQSEDFVLCAFVLLAVALDDAGKRHWRAAGGLAAFALFFLADIVFVVSGRTAYLVAAALALLLGWRHLRWRGLVSAGIMLCVLGAAAIMVSPYMRDRLTTSIMELSAWRTKDAVNSTALHLQFLEEGFFFVETAPVIGHGTGSIAEQYRKVAAGQTGAAAVASVNPHNQTLAVAIQLGLVGAVLLLAMWAAHFMLFRGGGLIDWIGVVIVADNVVSCLVNSHLFDFTQAWIYVFGVGVAGGTALRERDRALAVRSGAS